MKTTTKVLLAGSTAIGLAFGANVALAQTIGGDPIQCDNGALVDCTT